MKKNLFLAIVLGGLLFASCSSEMEDEPTPMNTCDTDNVSFSDDVLSLFNTSCKGCHGAAANFGGITLDSYEEVKKVVDSGRLIGSIEREAGFSPMPQGGSKLSDCNIEIVSVWVADGAQNN